MKNMSLQDAARMLAGVVETAGAHVCSIELHGEFDDAKEVLEAIRIVLHEFFEQGATDFDWDRAKRHLDEVKATYGELLNLPRVNPCFAIGVILEIESRFDSGERTESLFEAMMSLE